MLNKYFDVEYPKNYCGDKILDVNMVIEGLSQTLFIINGDENLVYEAMVSDVCYKNIDGFKKNNVICYIPEICNDYYTRQDFIDIAEGNEDVAIMLMEMCDWQHPSSLYEEIKEIIDENGVI